MKKKPIPAAGLRGLALREAAPDYVRTISLLRAAVETKINAAAGPGTERKWFDLDAVYPDRVVICLDGRHWSYPYTLDADQVTLAEPVEVIETYVPLKESAATDNGVALLSLVEAADGPTGVAWDATLIEAGLSLNGVFYSDALLREAAPLFENCRIRLLPDVKHVQGVTPDLRDVVGWGSNARFIEGAQPDTGRIVARLDLPGLPEHTRNLLVGAAKAGNQNIAGLSIDADGKGRMEMREGKKVKVPSTITRVRAVDLIVEPGAGGRLIRLVESAPLEGDEMKLRAMMLRLIESVSPEAFKKIDPETISEEDLEAAYREALLKGNAASLQPADHRFSEALSAQVAQVEQRLRMAEARAAARETIDACKLPAPAKDRLQRDFAMREAFTPEDVTKAIEDERAYLARFAEAGGRVSVPFDSVQVEDRSVRIAGMLDAFFDPTHANHRDVQSFKECYIEITGDRRVTGRLQDCDVSRMRESLGLSMREAVLDSSSFALALGDSITRRMLADYATPNQYDVWRNLANVVPLSDFRTQHRTRWGGFGDLPTVAEGDPYADGAVPDDEEATYKAAKRGRLSTVTLEMTRNDDVGLIRQIPVKLSRAAKRTLAKFILDFLRTNPAIYDGKALFHADHNNLGSAALSAASWSAARVAIMKQVEAGSNDRLGIPPKFLWVPADLEEAAYDLFKNRGTSNDQSFIQSQAPNIVPVWYWTDANDWVATADKNESGLIEIGFLDGREEPEIFVQDSPTVGSLFSNDAITYKIRHIYGGAPTDFRGGYKAVVA